MPGLGTLAHHTPAAGKLTGRKMWMSCDRDTRCELLAMQVAVSSLSPVSIQIWERIEMREPWKMEDLSSSLYRGRQRREQQYQPLCMKGRCWV